jgi:hypothetical protein
MFWTLFGYMPSLENIVSLDSKHVAMCLRRKRAEVTNFSTWEGSTQMAGRGLPSVISHALRTWTCTISAERTAGYPVCENEYCNRVGSVDLQQKKR